MNDITNEIHGSVNSHNQNKEAEEKREIPK